MKRTYERLFKRGCEWAVVSVFDAPNSRRGTILAGYRTYDAAAQAARGLYGYVEVKAVRENLK